MEGVGVGVGVGGGGVGGGGRLGRSSSRYGNTTVFSGAVRKWTKLWLPITPPPPPPSSNNNNNTNTATVPHLRLYKWTPLPDTPLPQTGDTLPVPQEGTGERPSKKFKFLPTAVLEEQKKEKASAGIGTNKKPDINDIPMEENQDSEENRTVAARQDLNELDLSLGLTSHEEEHDSDY